MEGFALSALQFNSNRASVRWRQSDFYRDLHLLLEYLDFEVHS